ncbi:MAG TPA: helix-turn-helix domain-containing protein [Gammaproteobacteria bacterium]|nr:helix-turn-helix domain-containing protein [Gammaproteobacteria bacterium]
MDNTRSGDDRIVPVSYEPPATYNLDLEIFSISALRRRVTAQCRIHTLEHIEFYLLIYITEGQCLHMVDFESIACAQGSLLVLRPGQIQRFDMTSHYQGWMLIFRPEFLQPRLQPSAPAKETATLVTDLEIFNRLESLPTHFPLNEEEQGAVLESIIRMSRDAQLESDTHTLHMLLRNQLHALLIRLFLARPTVEHSEATAPAFLKRFMRYRLAVERNFQRWHRVADYADFLGCSEKSLTRATLSVAGISAKGFLSKRIILEAKRLLLHTGMPVANIADALGFDEATNFVKFFRREVGCSPGDFRQKKSGG